MPEFNPYETRRLIGITANLRRPSTFILNMFFKRYIGPTGARKIAFDTDSRLRGIALFCAPHVAGKPVRDRGYTTKEFEPAYVKPWMNFDPWKNLDRMIGEDFNGSMSPAQRQAANLVRGFNDLKQITFTRLEAMACEGVVTGEQVISGDGIPTDVTVDYGRKTAFTVTLTSTDRWEESGVSPVDDVGGWCRDYAAENGVSPNRVVFGPLSWNAFAADPKFEKAVNQDYKRQTPGSQVDSMILGDATPGILMGVLKSGGGVIELWVYQQTYENEAGTETKMIDDYAVIIGCEHPELTQTQCFGTVLDPALGYQSQHLVDPVTGAMMDFAPWHAFAQKPAIGESIGLMCAPLMALTEPNAVMGIVTR